MKHSVIRARMNLKIPRAPLYFKGNEISLKAPFQPMLSILKQLQTV